LATDDLGAIAFHIIENDRHIAAGPVEMRLDHLQGEGSGHRGVESIASLLKDRHADGGCDPVRGGDDTEGSFDLGPGRERIRIDLGNVGFHAPAM
jgi:hypothetical protein